MRRSTRDPARLGTVTSAAGGPPTAHSFRWRSTCTTELNAAQTGEGCDCSSVERVARGSAGQHSAPSGLETVRVPPEDGAPAQPRTPIRHAGAIERRVWVRDREWP
eukprot:scaffold4735_cov403-Prasinococcus_capsulatus_cf.AAC.4